MGWRSGGYLHIGNTRSAEVQGPVLSTRLVITDYADPFVLLRAQQGNLAGDGMAFAAAVPTADDNAAAAVGQ